MPGARTAFARMVSPQDAGQMEGSIHAPMAMILIQKLASPFKAIFTIATPPHGLPKKRLPTSKINPEPEPYLIWWKC